MVIIINMNNDEENEANISNEAEIEEKNNKISQEEMWEILEKYRPQLQIQKF